MGLKFKVKFVVLIVGMFFGGIIYIGFENYCGGCVGDLLFIVFVDRLCVFLFCVDWLKIGILVRLDVCFLDFFVM